MEKNIDIYKKELDKPFCHYKRRDYVIQKSQPLNTLDYTAESEFSVLLIRPSSLGDVLLLTPVIRSIKETYPKCNISVMSMYPEVFENNPYVFKNIRFDHNYRITENQTYYMAYEWEPHRHIVEVYALIVGVDVHDYQPDLFITRNETEKANLYLSSKFAHTSYRTFICIHKESSWECRNWSQKNWDDLIHSIKTVNPNLHILSLGKGKIVDQEGTLSVKDLSLRQLFAVMNLSTYMVCIDSGLMHCSIALNRPTFGIFNITEASKRVPWRFEKLCSNHPLAIYRGIHHRGEIPTETPPQLSKEEIVSVTNFPSSFVVWEKIKNWIVETKNNQFKIIIPTYNDIEMTWKAVSNLRKKTIGWNYNIIISDDNSKENYSKELNNTFTYMSHVWVKHNKENLGFTKNINSALNTPPSCEQYLVLMNNDTCLISPDWLETLRDNFEQDQEVGVIGVKLLYPDNTIQHAGIVWDGSGGNHIYKHLGRHYIPANKYRYYKAVTGAVLATRMSLWNKLGGFCEEYKNSAEDTDYCFRVLNEGLKVAYNPDIEFYHYEGKTLGLNKPFDPENVRLLKAKHPDKVSRDIENYMIIDEFNSRHPEKNVKSIKEVPEQFTKLNKDILAPILPGYHIEIGSGFHPQHNCSHYEIIPNAPHLDQLYDLTKPLPIGDGQVAKIIANHVLEHVSWRLVPMILKDWARVMRSGGNVFIRTPNLEFIANMYVAGKTTPEAKNDEDYVKQHFGGTVTPTMYANIKFFSGQDYPSNFHSNCFDYGTLLDCLLRAGFRKAKAAKFEKIFSPGELQIIATK